jgi:ribosomal protein L24
MEPAATHEGSRRGKWCKEEEMMEDRDGVIISEITVNI